MADTVTHALSGVMATLAVPSASIEEKIFLVAGSVLPDLAFIPYIKSVSRECKKDILHLTEEDYISFGYSTPKIRFLKNIYFFTHGLPLTLFLFGLGSAYPLLLFFIVGIGLHIFYDLFMHKYKNKNLRPHPLYPLSAVTFNHGFTNGWKFNWKGRFIFWFLHIVLILIIMKI